MKKFIALAALVLTSMVTTTVYAQESNAQRRADRKAQRDAERARLKAEQQAADAVSYDDAVAALKAQKFVLEANQVMFRNGQTAFVTSNTNFVLLGMIIEQVTGKPIADNFRERIITPLGLDQIRHKKLRPCRICFTDKAHLY